MKKFLTFLIFISLVSCTDTGMDVETTGIPISFTTDVNISTRGESVHSLNGKSFGVRGFIHENLWTMEKPLAKPDKSWENTKVNCDQNGQCSYVMEVPKQTIQEWQFNRNYSFFAYYPYTTNSQGSITLSDTGEFGVPDLTYIIDEIPPLNLNLIPMYDIMFANSIDANAANDPKVRLHFRHCMTALQVVAENLNDKKTITLEELSMALTVKGSSIKIPLDGSPRITGSFTFNPGKPNAHYTLLTNDPKDDHIIESTLNKPPHKFSPKNHIFIIPQKGTTIEITYKTTEMKKAETTRLDAESDNFEAGHRYLISLRFIGDNMEVLLIDTDAWYDEKVDIEFE